VNAGCNEILGISASSGPNATFSMHGIFGNGKFDYLAQIPNISNM